MKRIIFKGTQIVIISTAILFAVSGCALWMQLTDKTTDAVAYFIVDTDYCKLAQTERDRIRTEQNAKIAARWEKQGHTGTAPTIAITCPQ